MKAGEYTLDALLNMNAMRILCQDHDMDLADLDVMATRNALEFVPAVLWAGVKNVQLHIMARTCQMPCPLIALLPCCWLMVMPSPTMQRPSVRAWALGGEAEQEGESSDGRQASLPESSTPWGSSLDLLPDQFWG